MLAALVVELGGLRRRAGSARAPGAAGRGTEAPEQIYGKRGSGASAIAAATVDEAQKTLAMAATGGEGVTAANGQRMIVIILEMGNRMIKAVCGLREPNRSQQSAPTLVDAHTLVLRTPSPWHTDLRFATTSMPPPPPAPSAAPPHPLHGTRSGGAWPGSACP